MTILGAAAVLSRFVTTLAHTGALHTGPLMATLEGALHSTGTDRGSLAWSAQSPSACHTWLTAPLL